MSDLFDIAVIGAGPAGANAAVAAADAGLRVVVLDEQPSAGGQIWRNKSASILRAPDTLETRSGRALRTRLSTSSVAHFCDVCVWHISRASDAWHIHYTRDGVSVELRATSLILATGAREYVQPIPGWTTPGVIGLAGATALFKQSLTVPGKRTVVAGTGPLVFYVASEIRRLGGQVAAVVTPNSRADWARAFPSMLGKPKLLVRGAVWMADLTLARVPIYWGHAVTKVAGDAAVSEVTVAKLNANWSADKAVANVRADSVCIGNGLIPQVEAAQMLGVGVHHDPGLGGWVPRAAADGVTEVAGLYLCGDGTGIRGADAAVVQGELVGLRVAADMGRDTAVGQNRARGAWARSARFGVAMTALSIPRSGLATLATKSTIMCRCESISNHDILGEVVKGAASANAVKSGLRAGMGPCGGKYCQGAVAALIADQTGQDVSEIALPTPRPPLRPIPLGIAAGTFSYDDLPIPKPAPL